MDFYGYIRENGKVGARNYVAVIPTVVCAAEAAQAHRPLGDHSVISFELPLLGHVFPAGHFQNQ